MHIRHYNELENFWLAKKARKYPFQYYSTAKKRSAQKKKTARSGN
jgi:hypothetical protein